MAGMETEQRKAYQRQPARAVLLDLSPPMDCYTCQNIRDALTSTLSVILQLHGVPCLTHMSIILLGDYPKCLFPLQPVKGNTQRVSVALKSIGQEMTMSSSGCVVKGIQEALEQFHRMTQNSKQGFGIPSQIEITIVTCRDEQSVRKTVLTSSDHLNLEHLRKITIVCVTDPDRVVRQSAALRGEYTYDDDEATKEGSLSQMTCSQVELGMSMLDIARAENDVVSLCNTLKHWILDCSTDCEHLHLCLPACLGDTPIIVKCDLQGRLIDPGCLPLIGEKFALNTGCATVRPASTKVSNAAMCAPLPLYKLRAEALIEPEGVCESVLFGMPIVLRPTACWKLDWEELERNQQSFAALCRMLQQKEKYLLTMADLPDIDMNPRFLVLPSPAPALSLMIKSVAVQELMMPSEIPSSEEQPTQEAMNAVEHCLDTLEVKTTYNPLTVQSNLYQALSITSNKKGSLSKGTGAFASGFKNSRAFSSRGRDSRSLGPRKPYNNATSHTGK